MPTLREDNPQTFRALQLVQSAINRAAAESKRLGQPAYVIFPEDLALNAAGQLHPWKRPPTYTVTDQLH